MKTINIEKNVKNSSLDITLPMVKQAYHDGVAFLDDSPNGDGVVCRIGDSWFYFGGLTAENSTVADFKANVPEDDIIKEIFDAIENIGMYIDMDKYNYYAAIFGEYGYYNMSLLEKEKRYYTTVEIIVHEDMLTSKMDETIADAVYNAGGEVVNIGDYVKQN